MNTEQDITIATTLEQDILKRLTSNGLSSKQAETIITIAKEDEALESMKGQWGKSVTEYPVQLRTVLWFSVKAIAFEWIEENVPNAFFRPLFD